MYTTPAQLVQNFGHTHIRCALRTKTTVVRVCIRVHVMKRLPVKTRSLTTHLRPIKLIFIRRRWLEAFFYVRVSNGNGSRTGSRPETARRPAVLSALLFRHVMWKARRAAGAGGVVWSWEWRWGLRSALEPLSPSGCGTPYLLEPGSKPYRRGCSRRQPG